jgi:hypothetical protein
MGKRLERLEKRWGIEIGKIMGKGLERMEKRWGIEIGKIMGKGLERRKGIWIRDKDGKGIREKGGKR